jgi:FkbM family methyltransferase
MLGLSHYNRHYFDQLEKHYRIYDSTDLKKMLRAPARMITSLVLSMVSAGFKVAIPVKAATFWGDWMTIVLPERVSTSIYRYGFFEYGLTAMLLRYLEPGMTFFDIGAHFGYFSLLASRIVGLTGHLHCFEPTRTSFEILKKNLGNSQVAKINRLAVWSCEEMLDFYDYGLERAAFNSLFDARLPENDRKKIQSVHCEVQGISLDEYCLRNNVKPDFIKIDAESAESEILRGMERVLSEHRPIISLEVGDEQIEGAGRSADVVRMLLDLKYRGEEFIGGRLVDHPPRDSYHYANVLFLPR